MLRGWEGGEGKEGGGTKQHHNSKGEAQVNQRCIWGSLFMGPSTKKKRKEADTEKARNDPQGPKGGRLTFSNF